MEVVLYEGAPLHPRRVQELAGQAVHAFEGADIHLIHCTTEQELSAAICGAAARDVAGRIDAFPFRTRLKTHLLRLPQIRYFRSADHHLYATLTTGETLVSRTMRISARAALAPLLDRRLFFQISKSTFVNMAHVGSVSLDGVHLDDGAVLAISRKYYAEFLAWSKAAKGKKHD